ncbi:MAG: dipeptidase PepE [Ginsengibacter sp.]
MKILALSSSKTGTSPYLATALPYLKDFLGEKKITIAFIPFASTGSHKEYFLKVKNAFKDFPYIIKMATPQNCVQLVEECNAIIIGGGNTFKLLHDLYEYKLVNIIRRKVANGTPFIGWSAGSNITGLTIGTTNDMPIIQPKSFKALSFFPFQINPHYFNVAIPGFNGETRDMRINEFLQLNPDKKVIGLPEGTALLLMDNKLKFKGNVPGIVFQMKNKIRFIKTEILPDEELKLI